jgi:hypothetical protein
VRIEWVDRDREEGTDHDDTVLEIGWDPEDLLDDHSHHLCIVLIVSLLDDTSLVK